MTLGEKSSFLGTFSPKPEIRHLDPAARIAEPETQNPSSHVLISQKVFIKLFCKSRFPHKFVNLFFMLVKIMDKLLDLCEN